ncbi:head morphogenesis protein [Martelella limonii]|uniref:head morphogenesis protein n=1 Tax=Martelella limonii TaxID=1647649 RepID=UPI001580E763|nr:head morphogenesis protein [Martelella limonii]
MIFDELYEKHRAKVAAAFQDAMSTIRSRVILDVVTARLRVGDIEGAIDAIQVDPAAFGVLERSLQEAFADGGEAMVDELPNLRRPDGPAVVWTFSVRNLEAERLVREQSSTLVTRITEDQRQGLRVAFSEGLARGDNPTRTALDVVGRVSRVTGRREGGFIGLNEPQIRFIESARQKLLSGDPELMREYLTLGTRDKRFDRTVAKAIREERPVDRDMLTRIIDRLKDRNLKLRADTIGLEETRTALFSARANAMRQQIDSGKLSASDVKKKWKHSGSGHPRLQHVAMNNVKVQIDEPFVMADGTRMMHPHDPKAPARHKIGCKCRDEYDVDYIAAGYRKYRARING